MNGFQIEARRDALKKQINELRGQRGAAVVAGETFDGASLVSAEIELAGLGDAEAALHKQRTDDAALAEQERRSAIRVIVEKAEAGRLAALEQLEATTRSMASAIASFDHETEAQMRALHSLGSPGAKTLRDALSSQPHPARRMALILGKADAVQNWDQIQFGSCGHLGQQPDNPWPPQYALDLKPLAEGT